MNEFSVQVKITPITYRVQLVCPKIEITKLSDDSLAVKMDKDPTDVEAGTLTDTSVFQFWKGAIKKITALGLYQWLKGKFDTIYSTFSGAHNDTTDRDAADAHPISAITGLTDALDGKVDEDLANNYNVVTSVVDMDSFYIYKKTEGSKIVIWQYIKQTLKAYFDTIYSTFSGSYTDLTDKPSILAITETLITISVTDWTGTTATKTVTGLTAASSVDIIYPTRNDSEIWAENGVFVSHSGTDLTFTAKSAPADDINLIIEILK
jgi:hypothetical protein